MTAQIIPFKLTEKRLDLVIESLSEGYELLHKMYGDIEELEYNLEKLQELYNKELLKHARVVGSSNIPIKFLDYSSKIKFDFDKGTIELDEDCD
jgi:hypothetical protein